MPYRYTAPEIIATHLCCDIYDIKGSRYQPTLFNQVAVYTYGEDYFCCPTKTQKPPEKDRNGNERGFVWKPVWFHEKTGRKVYCSTVDDMNKESDNGN